MNNNLGYDEVIDTLADGIEVYADIEKALGDGIGAEDLIVVWQNLDEFRDIYTSFSTAYAQFKDLTPEEATAVAEGISARTARLGTVTVEKINATMRLLARTYRYIDYILEEGKDLVATAKGIYAKPATEAQA